MILHFYAVLEEFSVDLMHFVMLSFFFFFQDVTYMHTIPVLGVM